MRPMLLSNVFVLCNILTMMTKSTHPPTRKSNHEESSFGSITPADQPAAKHRGKPNQPNSPTANSPASRGIPSGPSPFSRLHPSSAACHSSQSCASQAHPDLDAIATYESYWFHPSTISHFLNQHSPQLATINLDFVRFGRDRDRGSSVALLTWRCRRVGHYESYVQEAVKDVFRQLPEFQVECDQSVLQRGR
jgi:hypothetical protein